MSIYVWGYLDEYENEKEETHAAIESVLTSGKLILGENVSNFEDAFAKYCGAEFGVGVNSGTDALFIGLKSLGIGESDEVITVSNTAVPTVSAIVSTGAVPRFVDIDPNTYLMDVNLLEAAITTKTKCIIAVHLFGQCVPMEPLIALAKKHNLTILEDCAQAHGAKYQGKIAGSMSDVSAFSFYPTKILGTYGDGGMVLTSNPEHTKSLKKLRFYGMEKTYYAIEHGYNTRLDELHAAILLKKFNHLDEYLARRKAIAKIYDEKLKGTSLVLPEVHPDNEHSYYLYVCRHPNREYIMEELKKRDIFVNISYPWPVHTMDGYLHFEETPLSLPETEKAAKEIFSLPMYPTLKDEDQQKVIEALIEILN